MFKNIFFLDLICCFGFQKNKDGKFKENKQPRSKFIKKLCFIKKTEIPHFTGFLACTTFVPEN